MASSSAMDLKPHKMRSETYGKDVVQSMNELRQNDELCDFTVSADGKVFKVHKILLAATSDYFRAMLQGPMKESKEEKVDLKGVTAHALDLTLGFIYSGELELNWDNLLEVLNAASHLQVNAAMNICSDYIISLLTFANAEDLLHVSDMYSLSRVAEYYDIKVLTCFEEFSKTDQFLKLTAPELARFLGDDRLVISREHLLFELLCLWLCQGDKSGKKAMTGPLDESVEEVVKCIRFGLMSQSELVGLQSHWLTFCSGQIHTFITQALKYHTDCRHSHPKLTCQTQLRCADSDCVVFVHHGSSCHPFEVTAYNPLNRHFYQLASDISGHRDCRITTLEDFVFVCRVVDCGGGTLMNSLLRFDLRHLALHELTPCRHLHIDPVLLCKGKWLYIFGGTTENYQAMDAVECYDISSNTWLELPPLPQPGHSMGGVVDGELIYLSGGMCGQDRQPSNALIAYNPNTQTWSTKSPMHCARRLHQMASLNSQLYVLGGSHSFHQNTQIPMETYDTATDQWTLLAATLAGRSVGHFIILENNILSIGREHHEASEEDIWHYDMQSQTWKQFVKAPRRMGLASATCCLGKVNFHDNQVSKKVILDKR